ncbi:transcription termination/antitermination NusG family protein [Muribaculum sp.]|uniref:phage integrase SAM-like domain-containing protein n=1 Tax=Muribaculum sp. TaxID=1918611 RepID=UPI0023C6C79C|nr:transcription termination/antitermination NusG family protein [Muribaculum sp.]MDE5706273.1 phage integrase SAM-like domain-containing protein [Muribaculum sp.]
MIVAGTTNRSTASSRQKALSAYVNYIGTDLLEFDSFTSAKLNGWAIWLIHAGHTIKTVIHYMKHLSALYGKAVAEGMTTDSGAFNGIVQRLATLSDDAIRISGNPAITLRDLILSTDATQKANLAKDITIFAILAGGIGFNEIATYGKDDYTGDDPTLKAMIARYSKPRNKYLFPLRQSERTTRQMHEYVNTLFSATMRINRALTPADVWSTIAYDCGISPEDIMSCTGLIPAANPAFALTHASTSDSDRRAAIIRRVSDMLTCNPTNWYALQMRQGTDYDDVARRIEVSNGEFQVEDIYYPCREIARRTGRKLISENKPVVAGLMFVKCRFTDITAMMRHISDIAWCYRQTARTGSAYAAIPQTQIDLYQQTIGIFTPSTEIFPVGTLPIAPGDRVVVIGGEFSGQPAVLQQLIGPDSAPTICRLTLPGANSIEWRVDTDPRLIRKITEQQYDTLVTEISAI